MAVKPTTVEEAVARVEDWKGKDVSYKPIAGGITNPNFKVTVDGENYFLKVPGAGTDFIDRDACHAANVIASESKSGPEACYYYPDTGVEIVKWLDGYRQVTFGDVYDYKIFKRSIEAIREYHHVTDTKIPLEQSIFDQNRDMVERASKGDYLPAWHERMLTMMDQIEEAMDKYGAPLAPCHNDFWTNNMMYNEEKDDLKLIDFEYASMNDPACDLGLYSTVNFFPEAMDVEMTKIYNYGEFDEKLFARIKLFKIATDIKWAYWSLQQYLFSDVDNDFMQWYGPKVARLQHLWNDPRYDYWLGLLTGKKFWKNH
jgi:thiamine kinase-like enzyme